MPKVTQLSIRGEFELGSPLAYASSFFSVPLKASLHPILSMAAAPPWSERLICSRDIPEPLPGASLSVHSQPWNLDLCLGGARGNGPGNPQLPFSLTCLPEAAVPRPTEVSQPKCLRPTPMTERNKWRVLGDGETERPLLWQLEGLDFNPVLAT